MITRNIASAHCSTQAPTRSARDFIPSRRPLRLAQAACTARAGSRARKRIWNLFLKNTPILFSLFVRGLQVAARGATLFGRLLAGSLILTLFSDVFVNIGMNSGLLPIVGAPL